MTLFLFVQFLGTLGNVFYQTQKQLGCVNLKMNAANMLTENMYSLLQNQKLRVKMTKRSMKKLAVLRGASKISDLTTPQN